MHDNYFKMPEEVAKGGVQEALRTGQRDVTLGNLLWQMMNATGSLARADRIHLFVTLCGGAPKVEVDDIKDVTFEVDGDSISAAVVVRPKLSAVWVNFKITESSG